MNKVKIEEAIKSSYSYDEVCKKVYGYSSGKSMIKMRNFVFNNSIDTSHFDCKMKTRKYTIIEKECPICRKKFNTKMGHKREKITCSCACANTYFRSGENNGGYKTTDELTGEAKYVRICFDTHKKECVVCGEKNIVAVHHYDSNHSNDDVSNLIPLCPTHHQYMHSKYRNLIISKVEEFRDNFLKSSIPV